MKHMGKRIRSLTALLCCLAMMAAMIPPAFAADGQPERTNNRYDQDYDMYGTPFQSYLYANQQGGVTRVEFSNGEVAVEDYDSSFQLVKARTIQAELPLWGGFFNGQDYNFLIFGQNNPSERDSVEVLRVVKYDKSWNRLGSASLYGGHSYTMFTWGGFDCAEYGGMLYIHTCHELYAMGGINHQSNLTLAVRQRDMTITDKLDDMANPDRGYISHSFKQFILVDQNANIVTLNHGDNFPRGIILGRYTAKAGGDEFINKRYVDAFDWAKLASFAGGSTFTGGSVGGLEETSSGYVAAYSHNGGTTDTNVKNWDVYLAFASKGDLSARSAKLTAVPGGTTPVLVSTGLNGGYVLWNQRQDRVPNDTLYYTTYDANGNVGAVKTASAPLSDCNPIYYNGKVVWYSTYYSAPTFYILDGSGVRSVTVDRELNSWEHLVTFDPQGGEIDYASIATQRDGFLPYWPTVAREGYTFDGWYLQPESGPRFQQWKTFEEDTTLYAHWTKVYTPCAITFDANGGSVSTKSLTTSKYGQVMMPTPTRTGCLFKGWYTAKEGGQKVDSSTQFDAPTQVYAQWAEKTYNVIFITNGGVADQTSMETNGSGKLAQLPGATREGYTLEGWYTASSGGQKVTTDTVFSKNTYLYARWVKLPIYTIIFQNNDGSSRVNTRQTNKDGKVEELPIATRSGYTFDGWYTSASGGQKITTDTVFSTQSSVYAHWTKEVPDAFTITFKGQGGTVETDTLKTDKDGKLSQLPGAAREGYTLEGWYTAAEGGEKIADGRVFTADTTVYARWTKAEGKVVTFNGNGGTAGEASLTAGSGGKLEKLPAATRSGYTFDGWYTAAEGGEKITADRVFTADTTVYAHWTKAEGKVVTFNGNGGTASEASLTAGSGGKLEKLPTATRSGYTFDGWYTAAEGGERITADRVFTADATVYAHWTKTQTQTPSQSSGFTDLQPGAYYIDAVKWAVDTGVTSGTSSTAFSPNAPCSRAQAVTFLWRAAGSPAPRGSGTGFRDVKTNAYYYDAVRWAVEQGITSGTSATTFSPDQTVTREQTVTFLYRAAGSPVIYGRNPFYDVKDSAYSADAVKWAVGEQVTTGTSATTFSPTQSCTRGQIVTFLYRAQ